MRPGEYMGADGDSRRWLHQSGSWRHCYGLCQEGIHTADLRAAAKALAAVADDLETKYIVTGYDLRLMVSDVVAVQRLVHGEWERAPHDSGAQRIIDAFRAGQKHGERSQS